MLKLDDEIARQLLRDGEIDLGQYWNVVWRRKWSILALAVVAVLFALLVVSRMQPVYRAGATVMIESANSNVVAIQDVYGIDTRAEEYYQTQFEILKSRPLAEKVVKRLDLVSHPEFQPAEGLRARLLALLPESDQPWLTPVRNWLAGDREPADAAERQRRVVERYREMLEATAVSKTQLVRVTFNSADPALAAEVANEHARAFIESYLDAKEQMTRTASEWMNVRLDELRSRLVAAEEKLQTFREEEQLIDLDGIRALPALELNETTQKLVDARRDLSEAESAYRQMASLGNAPLDRLLAIPSIKQDPLVQQFRQARASAELRVAELSKRYGPQHPKMIAATSEKDSAERALAHQVESVKEAIRNQYEVSRSKASALDAAMATAKSGVQLVGRKESRYRELSREAETSRQLYDLFYQRASETQETVDLVTANARVIEPAVIPLLPSAPDRKLIVAIALVLALVAGVVLAFLREMLDNTVRHRGDVEQKIGQSLLGLVPLLGRSRRDGPIRFGQGDQGFEEAIRTVRTGISLSRLDNPHKLILVTSAVADEGKTTIAVNLALAFAQLGRVLLIDADLRRPSLAAELDIGRQRPGLAELCAGRASGSECITRLEEQNLDVLTAGRATVNALELLESKRFKSILGKLASVYDRIIIDCPPVLPVSDTQVLANQCDAMVFVIRADSTPVLQVNRALQQLRRSSAALTGVVLNRVDVDKLASYGEYGGGDYYYGSYAANAK